MRFGFLLSLEAMSISLVRPLHRNHSYLVIAIVSLVPYEKKCHGGSLVSCPLCRVAASGTAALSTTRKSMLPYNFLVLFLYLI